MLDTVLSAPLQVGDALWRPDSAGGQPVGAPRIALTTGGRLAELARAEGVPVMSPPGGFQPRATVVYMLIGALECAALAGVTPSLRGEIEAAAGLLETLVEEWGPDTAAESQAKALAARLNGTIAIVNGAGLTAPVARRWKTQINENSKLPAFCSELPEADHNEVCGWDASDGLAPMSAVFLDDRDLSDRER